jgi:hypothetical protein
MPPGSAFLAFALAAAQALPAAAPVETRVPDVRAELRAFAPTPPVWSADVVNAVFGEGVLAQRERRSGWLADPAHWEQVDYMDRAASYPTHGWLARRGIRAEQYAYNEYYDTLHLDAKTAVSLFGERGLARGLAGELVVDTIPGVSGANFVADPLEPRWATVLAYDASTSPLLGDALSQDLLGGAVLGMGRSSIGRFGNAAARGFAEWRARRGESQLGPLRAELRNRIGGAFAQLPALGAAPSGRLASPSAAAQSLCDDPLLAEYQVFQNAANLAAFSRYYTELRKIGARAGREFDVHGNLTGSLVGTDPYPIALGELVDSVWWESSGSASYDQLQHRWWNAWGALRFELGEALGRGAKPVYALAHPVKQSHDLLLHELAEISAGGGVPLLNPDLLARDAPASLPAFEAMVKLRDSHRELFSARGRKRWAEVALLYSIPTFLFDPCVPTVSTPDTGPQNDLSGTARTLEDAHVPFDAVVLNHPDLRAGGTPEPDLSRYRLVIAPSVERVSEAQLALLERYLRGGGALAVLGRFGARDENNRPRSGDALARLRAAGRVRVLLAGGSFPASRVAESPDVAALEARAQAEILALLPDPILAGELPARTWVKTWRHASGLVSLHFVNYDVGFESGVAQPTQPARLRVRLPRELHAREAIWLAPGEAGQSLALERKGEALELTVPSLRVYGVLVLGPAGGEARASALALGDRRIAATRFALGGDARAESRLGPVTALRAHAAQDYAARASQLLRAVSGEREAAYLAGVRELGEFGDPVAAFDFGGRHTPPPWKGVTATSAYRAETGFGWLPSDDDSRPSPEESAYASGLGTASDALREMPLAFPFWPYEPEVLPKPLHTAIVSGKRQRFRVDLPNGDYRVSLVAANGSYNQRNFLVSGLVTAQGAPVLLDTPLSDGAFVRRSFTTTVSDGALQLALGGPTGFGIAALLVERGPHTADPLEAGALRSFSVSPRHPNPDWAPLADVVLPALESGTAVTAASAGIPLVDLGSLAQADIGDVVVARARIERANEGEAVLRVGASSAAHVYLNGARVLELANVKGVERDEGVARVKLRAGANELAIVLERFWERRWLFYASLS